MGTMKTYHVGKRRIIVPLEHTGPPMVLELQLKGLVLYHGGIDALAQKLPACILGQAAGRG